MATLIFGGGYLAYKQVKKHRGKQRAKRLMIANTNSEVTDPNLYQNYNHELDSNREEEEDDDDNNSDENLEKVTSTSPRLTRRTSDEIIHGRIEGLRRRDRDGEEEKGRKSEGDRGWRDDENGEWARGEGRENLIDFNGQDQQVESTQVQAPAMVVGDDPTGWVDEILREKELEAARTSIRQGGGGPGVAVRQVGYPY